MGRLQRLTDRSAVDSPVWRVLAWFSVLAQAAMLLVVFWLQRFGGAWIVTAFLVASLAFLFLQDRVPALIDFLFTLAALINAAGWAFDIYDWFAWFDEAVHFFSGFVGIAALLQVLGSYGWLDISSSWFRTLLVGALLGFGLGVGWELIEAAYLQLAFVDTLVDIAMDTLGAALGCWFSTWVARARVNSSPA